MVTPQSRPHEPPLGNSCPAPRETTQANYTVPRFSISNRLKNFSAARGVFVLVDEVAVFEGDEFL